MVKRTALILAIMWGVGGFSRALPTEGDAAAVNRTAVAADAAATADLPPYMHAQNRPAASIDYYCGAYAVWHALHYFDRERPLAELVERLDIDERMTATIADLIRIMGEEGVCGTARQTSAEYLDRWRDPFIVYAGASMRRPYGHFAFAAPAKERGSWLLLDGDQRRTFTIQELAADEDWTGVVVILSDAGLRKKKMIIAALFGIVSVGGVCWIVKWNGQKGRRAEIGAGLS